MGRGLREGSRIALAALIALVLLAPARAGADAGIGLDAGRSLASSGTTIGFWAGEAVPGTDWDEPDTYWARRDTHFYTPRLWRVLRRNRIPLYFNLRYRRDFGPVPPGKPQRHDALRIIRTANRLGVPVWAWVLIPYSNGYWAWEGAAAQQFAAVKSLVHWAHEKRVRLRGLALDPEPRLRTPFETTAAIMGGGSNAVFAALFKQALDPVGQCAAWRGYARIVRWSKAHRVPIVAAPMPAALDDLEDRRLALQDAAGFILPNAPWDDLYFQAYRSVFAYYSGHDPGPGIVASYFLAARREFGDAGQVSLGSSGRGPYRRFASLLGDVRLAATLGAREVPIYSLERTLRAYGGPSAVTRLAGAAQHPYRGPAASRSTAATVGARNLRGAVHRADRAATASTPEVSAARGTALRANSWPDGCGQ
ncbi:MAG TPA: hypothetical protein VG898_10580 [Solirubrobacterales bacterium]|nr:hypothetical protein [Solirubrobacterales bacterium]